MKSFLKFLAVLFVIFFVSAVSAPLLYKILPFKFERIFSRLVMILSILAALLFVRIRREAFVRYGLAWKEGSLRQFLTGCAAGILSLSSVILLQGLFRIAHWEPAHFSLLGWIFTVGTAAFAALLVGVLEEFFFRGFIFRRLLERFSWPAGLAAAATSLLYSLVHFVGDQTPFVDSTPDVKDSLRLMLAPLVSLAHWPSYWPAAAGLFLFGLLLNLTVLRTGSLFMAIGLHASGVFFLKMDGSLIRTDIRNPVFFGGERLIDGVLGWFVLGICAAVLARFLKRSER